MLHPPQRCHSGHEGEGVWLTFAGHITDQVPTLDEVGFFALQPNDALIRPLLEGLVLIKALLGLLQDRE